MIIAYVPCRLKSSRLPEKAIRPINGLASIERCLINSMAIPGIDKVILATSTNKEDDILEKYTMGGQVEITRGSENDVLARFLPSVNKYHPEHIVRITGDCPLVSAELGSCLIRSHKETNADATFTLSKTALGISLEIYRTSAVRKLRELFPKTEHSEYLVYYFLNNPNHFKLNLMEAPEKFIKPWRLTLDEENDLELFNMIYSELKIDKKPVDFNEVIAFFKNNPAAASYNINNVVKYRQDPNLIDMLKKATTWIER